MKIYKDKKYVKLVPSRYEPIEDSILDLCATDKKRLNSDERKSLELKLLMHNLETHDKLVFKIIKECKYKGVVKVWRRDDNDEHRVLFEGAPEVRISSETALILNGGAFDKVIKVL